MSNTIPYKLVKLKVKDYFKYTTRYTTSSSLGVYHSDGNAGYINPYNIIDNMLTGVFNNDKVHLFAYRNFFTFNKVADIKTLFEQLQLEYLAYSNIDHLLSHPVKSFDDPMADDIAIRIVDFTKGLLKRGYHITYGNDDESTVLLNKLDNIKRTYKDTPLKKGSSEHLNESVVSRVFTRIGVLLTAEWEFFYGIDKNLDVRELMNTYGDDPLRNDGNHYLSKGYGFFNSFTYPNTIAAETHRYSWTSLKQGAYPDYNLHVFPDRFPRTTREALALPAGASAHKSSSESKLDKMVNDSLFNINYITDAYVYNELLKLPNGKLDGTVKLDLRELIKSKYESIINYEGAKNISYYPNNLGDIFLINLDYRLDDDNNIDSFDINTFNFIRNLSQRLYISSLRSDIPFVDAVREANVVTLSTTQVVADMLAKDNINEVTYKDILALWNTIPYKYKAGLYDSNELSPIMLTKGDASKEYGHYPVYKYIIEEESPDYRKLIKDYVKISDRDEGNFIRDMIRVHYLRNDGNNPLVSILNKEDILLMNRTDFSKVKDISTLSANIARFKEEFEKYGYDSRYDSRGPSYKYGLLRFIFSCILHVASMPSETDIMGLTVLLSIAEKSNSISNYNEFYKRINNTAQEGLSLTQIRELGKRVLDIKHNESPFVDKDKRLEFINNAIDPYTIALTATGVLKMNLNNEENKPMPDDISMYDSSTLNLVKLNARDYFDNLNSPGTDEENDILEDFIDSILSGLANNDKTHIIAHLLMSNNDNGMNATNLNYASTPSLFLKNVISNKLLENREADRELGLNDWEDSRAKDIVTNIVDTVKTILSTGYFVDHNSDSDGLILLEKLEELKTTYKSIPINENALNSIRAKIGIILKTHFKYFYGVERHTDLSEWLKTSNIPNRGLLDADVNYYSGVYTNPSLWLTGNVNGKTRDIISDTGTIKYDVYPRSNRETVVLTAREASPDKAIDRINTLGDGFIVDSYLLRSFYKKFDNITKFTNLSEDIKSIFKQVEYFDVLHQGRLVTLFKRLSLDEYNSIDINSTGKLDKITAYTYYLYNAIYRNNIIDRRIPRQLPWRRDFTRGINSQINIIKNKTENQYFSCLRILNTPENEKPAFDDIAILSTIITDANTIFRSYSSSRNNLVPIIRTDGIYKRVFSYNDSGDLVTDAVKVYDLSNDVLFPPDTDNRSSPHAGRLMQAVHHSLIPFDQKHPDSLATADHYTQALKRWYDSASVEEVRNFVNEHLTVLNALYRLPSESDSIALAYIKKYYQVNNLGNLDKEEYSLTEIRDILKNIADHYYTANKLNNVERVKNTIDNSTNLPYMTLLAVAGTESPSVKEDDPDLDAIEKISKKVDNYNNLPGYTIKSTKPTTDPKTGLVDFKEVIKGILNRSNVSASERTDKLRLIESTNDYTELANIVLPLSKETYRVFNDKNNIDNAYHNMLNHNANWSYIYNEIRRISGITPIAPTVNKEITDLYNKYYKDRSSDTTETMRLGSNENDFNITKVKEDILRLKELLGLEKKLSYNRSEELDSIKSSYTLLINEVHGTNRQNSLKSILNASIDYEKEKITNSSATKPHDTKDLSEVINIISDSIVSNSKYDELNTLFKSIINNAIELDEYPAEKGNEFKRNHYLSSHELNSDLENVIDESTYKDPKYTELKSKLTNLKSAQDTIDLINSKLTEFDITPLLHHDTTLSSLDDVKEAAKKLVKMSTLDKNTVTEKLTNIEQATTYSDINSIVETLEKDNYNHQSDYTEIKGKLDSISDDRTVKTQVRPFYDALYTESSAKQVDKSIAEIKELVADLKSRLNNALEAEEVYKEVKSLLNDVKDKHAIYTELVNSINSADKNILETYKTRLLAAKKDVTAIERINTLLETMDISEKASTLPMTTLSDVKSLAKKAVNKSNISEDNYDAKIQSITDDVDYTAVANSLDGLSKIDDLREDNYNNIKQSLDAIPAKNQHKTELTGLFNELYNDSGAIPNLSDTMSVFRINGKVNALKSRIEEVEEEIRNTPNPVTVRYNQLVSKIENQVLSDKRKEYLKEQLSLAYNGLGGENSESLPTELNGMNDTIDSYIRLNPRFTEINNLFKTMVDNAGGLDDLETLDENPELPFIHYNTHSDLSDSVWGFDHIDSDSGFNVLKQKLQDRIDIHEAVKRLNVKLNENNLTPLTSYKPTLTPIETFRASAIKVLDLMEISQEDYASKVDTINRSLSYKEIVNVLDGLDKASDVRPNYFDEIKTILANIPLTDLRRQDLVNRYNELYDQNGPKSLTLPIHSINEKATSLITDLRKVNNDIEAQKLEQLKQGIQNKINQLTPVKRRNYALSQYNNLNQRPSVTRREFEEFNDKVDDLLAATNEYKTILNNNTVPEFDGYVTLNKGNPEQNWTRGLVSFEGNETYNAPYTESHANIDTDINRLNTALNNNVIITQKSNALKRFVNEILNNKDIVKLAKKEAGYVFNGEADNDGTKPASDTLTYIDKMIPAIASEDSVININNFIDKLKERYTRYNTDLEKRKEILAKIPTIRDITAKNRFEQDYNDIYNWKFSDKEDGNTIKLPKGIDSIDMPENKVFTYEKVTNDLIALLARVNEEARLQDTKPVLSESLKHDTDELIDRLVPDNRRQFYRNEYNKIINDRFSTDETLTTLKNQVQQVLDYINDIKGLLRNQVEPNLLKYSVLNTNKVENQWNRDYPAYDKTEDFYNRLTLNKLPANTVLADIEKLRVLKSEVIGKDNTADALKYFNRTILSNNDLMRTVKKESGWTFINNNDLVGTPPLTEKDTLIDVLAKKLVTLNEPTQIYNNISKLSDKFTQYKKQQGLRETITTELAKLKKDNVRTPLEREYNLIRDWRISEPEEGGISIADNQHYPEYDIADINRKLEDLIKRVSDALNEQSREEAIEDALRRRRQQLLELLDNSSIKQNDPQYNVIADEINQANSDEQLDKVAAKFGNINSMYDKYKALSNQIKYIEGTERQQHHQNKIDELKRNLVVPVTDARWSDAEAKINEAINANNLYNQIKDLINELGNADIIVREVTPDIPSAGRQKLSLIRDRLVARKNYLDTKKAAESEIDGINTGDTDKDNRFKRESRETLSDIDNGDHDLSDYAERMRKLRTLRQKIQDYLLTRQVEEDRINAVKRNIETRIGFVLGDERRNPLETRLNELKTQPIFVESDWQNLADKTTDKINSNGVYLEVEKLIDELGEGHPTVVEVRPRIADADHAELINIRTKLHGIALIKRKKEFLHKLNKRINDILIRGEFSKRIDAAENLPDLLALEPEIHNEIQVNFIRKETKAAINNLPASESLRGLLETEERQAKIREALIDIRNRALRRKSELDVLDARKPKKPRTPLTPIKPPSIPKIKQYHYDLDPTGRDKNNLILNERHTITVENRTPQNVIIPGFAPFFRRSLIVRDMSSGHELIEGIDYLVVWPIDVTPDTEDYTPLYGGIQFIDEEITGQFEIDYQTIGGQFALDGVQIAQALANQANDPLTTTFESLIGRPIKLPPLEHVHGIEDFVGFNDLTNSVLSLRDAIELLAKEDAENHPGYDTLIDAYFKLKSELGLYKNTLSGMDNKLTDELNRLEEHLNTSIGDTRTELNNNFNIFKDGLNDNINQLRKDVGNQINQFQNTVDQSINLFKIEVKGNIDKLVEKLTTDIERITREINTAKDDLERKITQVNTDLLQALNAYKASNDEAVRGLGERLDTLSNDLSNRVRTLEEKPANSITDSNGKLSYNGKDYLNSDDLTEINRNIQNAMNAGADWNTNLRNIPNDIHYYKNTWVKTIGTSSSGTQHSGLEVWSNGVRYRCEVNANTRNWKMHRAVNPLGGTLETDREQHILFPPTPGEQHVVYRTELSKEIGALRDELNGISNVVGGSLQNVLNGINSRLNDLERRVRVNEEFRESITFEF